MPLDPLNSYYIRNLLRQNFDRLTPITTSENGPTINPLSDLNIIISQLYQDEAKAEGISREILRLAMMHKQISGDKPTINRQHLHDIESRLFWLLGLQAEDKERNGLILIVDDQPVNVNLLEVFLKRQGYDVTSMTNSTMVVSSAKKLLPNLILLDIRMPEMNGFEVCQKLKDDPQTHDIPVLFLSGSTAYEDKIRGFDTGGADYITKPFQLEEVLARVEHQLRLYALQKRLAQQNESLQKEIQARQVTENLYRDMFAQAVDGMFQSSAHGEYIAVNASLAQMYGYASPSEMMQAVNSMRSNLYVESDRRHQFITQINSTGILANFESQVYHQDGSIIWVSESARMVYDSTGKFLYYEGTVRDITHYKQ
ncbi:MAG: response regulator [Leptolyngbyaceae bacterium]|nr:response regulator [Leptolyngbyaceae bacterium]